jgi:type II secretory pathway pseudopilin PulG
MRKKPFQSQNKAGITLLEMTVVVMVLLTLIGILFVAASRWKRGVDRAANIMNLRNAQQAMRGYSLANQIQVGDPVPQNVIFGPDGYLLFPEPVATVTYDVPDQISTPPGILYLRASADGAPTPKATPNAYGPYIEDVAAKWW